MSRFHGPQGEGASRRARERRMWQAHLRQRAYAYRMRGQPFMSSLGVLTLEARSALVRGTVDPESYREAP